MMFTMVIGRRRRSSTGDGGEDRASGAELVAHAHPRCAKTAPESRTCPRHSRQEDRVARSGK
jgi:hypothetical protein